MDGLCVVVSTKTCTELNGQCARGVCNKESGECEKVLLDDEVCNDKDPCTTGDQCIQGECIGVPDTTSELCGGEPSPPPDSTEPIIWIFTGAGLAGVIGLIVGAAFLVKRVRNSNLLDPDTWNPDPFSTVGNNALYRGAETVPLFANRRTDLP